MEKEYPEYIAKKYPELSEEGKCTCIYIATIAIKKEYRRKGNGKKLMKYVEDYSRKEGYDLG